MSLHLLHGFLGRPSDWSMWEEGEAHKWDLFSDASIHQSTLGDWGVWLCKEVQKLNDNKPLLLGYSMGGRLGLHALFSQPSLWKGAIFVSTHPGMKNEQERVLRLRNDWHMADRFLKEEWSPLIEEWNGKNLFKGGPFLERKEGDFKREYLAASLFKWSLGLQCDFSKLLSEVDVPILWIVGEKDEEYLAYAEGLRFLHPLSKIWVAPDSSHRVPWACAKSFKNSVQQFMESL